ncbi:2',3'-cyclic-nucleotide 3'-phosphodiesteras-like protein [Lophiotrema nucula]|uniref:2',3'-cyclic-nucleotide 3'-phosphodiesteras-like protein n=1 Tax=Lophiotrema nucula TaxID=690887 RepID=A0A6A5ZRM2_9PLEO|nr:2',3'-cyclic-nucleotide 3'-phosphodiesteras-like protein [Lophiotrema nucula]
MPGSSLWLLPPPSSPLNSLLTSLIAQTSSHFSSPHLFIPHVTLTSSISPSTYASDPQAWLDSLPLPPSSSVSVTFGELESRDIFVQKLFILVKKDGVKELGKVCRRVVNGYDDKDGLGAEKWAEDEYMSHLSLLYHDCPVLSPPDISTIENLVLKAGVSLEGKGELGGWTGGKVVLVATDKPIEDWAPIAERTL